VDAVALLDGSLWHHRRAIRANPCLVDVGQAAVVVRFGSVHLVDRAALTGCTRCVSRLVILHHLGEDRVAVYGLNVSIRPRSDA
jgi:hypothetical protein